MLKRIRLGDDVDTYCGRCKEERRHQVVALHSDGRIERVTCNFCHNTHLYRDPAAKPRNRAWPPACAAGRKLKHIRSRTGRRAPIRLRPFTPSGIKSHIPGSVRVKWWRRGQGKIDVRFGRDLRTFLHAG
jgi:hypothetical protein